VAVRRRRSHRGRRVGPAFGRRPDRFFLFAVEAQVFKQQDLAVFELRRGRPRPSPHAVFDELNVPGEQLRQHVHAGRMDMSATRLPSGRPRCDIRMSRPPCLNIPNGGQRCPDARIVGDLAALQRHIEVHRINTFLPLTSRSSSSAFSCVPP